MTKNKWVNLLLEAIGCFISALGIYSFAVAAGVVVLCACLLVLFFFLMRKDAVKKERISDTPFDSGNLAKGYVDVPFLLTVAVGVCATIFSFVWGMTR